ncbi:MAG: DM13 domain-containing protein [Actinomycetota bacterium]|nr:DM13 domain-containing protein [Actinomycetota bacterium]
MRSLIRRHRTVAALAGLVAAAGLSFGLYWFAPWNLFVDKRVLGDQDYLVPADIDLTKYRTAVIWCRRFKVGFGVAPIEPA